MDNKKKSFYKWIFCCLIFWLQQTQAQFTPYFTNFDLSQYGGGNQNWDVSKANDGRVYVANNKGLLEFDGIKWSLHTTPNKTTIRSVLAIENRVYIGSYEEFGFWERSTYGTLSYTSLNDKIIGAEFLNEEFWQIIDYEGKIVFRSFRNIYIYDGSKIEMLNPEATVISIDLLDGELYVSTLKSGIYKYENARLQPFISSDRLLDSKVVSIHKFHNGLIIATALEGFFLFDGRKLTEWKTPINNIIKQHQLNSFSVMESGELVCGTIQNGIYITDANGGIKFHISKENGLINNTVLSQLVDSDNQVWVGFDNGLAKIDLKNKLSFFTDITGRLGAVYDVIEYEGRIYIGSNTGLYYLDGNQELQFVAGSQGQVWDLKEINGQLFCGHNNGTYIVNGNQLEEVSIFTGGWSLNRVPGKDDLLVQGTYAGIIRFKNEAGKWFTNHTGETTIPIRFLVFEDHHSAWAAHAYKGLYKLKFSQNYDSIVNFEEYGVLKGLSSNYNIRVYNLKNEICIKANDGWYKYEPLLDSIVPFEVLNQRFGKNGYIISESDSDLLAINKKDYIAIGELSGSTPDLNLVQKFFKDRMIVGYERISRLNDSILSLNLNDGFLRINRNTLFEEPELNKPNIETIVLDDEIIKLDDDENIMVHNGYKNLELIISSPNSEDHHFEYAFVNIDSSNWNSLANEKLDLSNLGHGDFAVAIRTANDSGFHTSPIKIGISVSPPWYRSKWALIAYAFLILSLLLLFYILHKKKIDKEQRLLKIELAQEQRERLIQKTIENDRRIVELKNEALESEVTLKSKQLANSAMALVKKNETLQELKKDLTQHKSSFEDFYSYKRLLKKIDHSISHKDEWHVFESNFNQVHEEFLTILKSRHPDLSSKDLKVCAFIKMNLSSKEIAPLLNISVRGVETQRYRLKQKLNLESDKSVSDYLRNVN